MVDVIQVLINVQVTADCGYTEEVQWWIQLPVALHKLNLNKGPTLLSSIEAP